MRHEYRLQRQISCLFDPFHNGICIGDEEGRVYESCAAVSDDQGGDGGKSFFAGAEDVCLEWHCWEMEKEWPPWWV